MYYHGDIGVLIKPTNKMKQIIEVRTNFMKFLQQRDGEFLDMAEVILLAHTPEYELINKQLVRKDSVSEYRFFANKEAIKSIIEDFQSILTKLEENE